MPPYTTPSRNPQQQLTPNGPERVLRPAPRPEHRLTRAGLQAAITEEVQFAQTKIVAKIDYIIKELQTEKDLKRREMGWKLIGRLQRDDLADCNKRIEDLRTELSQRERAVWTYERELRDDVARGRGGG